MGQVGVSEAKRTGTATVTGLAGRYATALFDLAMDTKAIDQVADSLGKITQALADVPEMQGLITNPMVSRAEGGKAIAAVAAQLGLDSLTSKCLGVLASNRRLAELPKVIAGFGQLLAAQKGETSAEVTSAHALSDAQLAALRAKLRASLGQDVTLITKVDPAILGGLVVRIGSKLIDSSLKTKLDSLNLAMTKAA
jgi:F-type H+-transporting ATPase subunit delta